MSVPYVRFNRTKCPLHEGKFAYLGRKEARRAARIIHPGEHKDVYPCSDMPGRFHIGKMPEHIRTRGLGVRRGVDHMIVARGPSPLWMPKQKVS